MKIDQLSPRHQQPQIQRKSKVTTSKEDKDNDATTSKGLTLDS